MEVEKLAVGALLLLSRRWAGPGRPGRGRARLGPRPRPGPARSHQGRRRDGHHRPGALWVCAHARARTRAPLRPRRPPHARTRCSGHCACRRSPGLEMSASSLLVSQALGPLGALLAGALSPAGSDPRETGTRTLWSQCSWAVRSEGAKCCPL